MLLIKNAFLSFKMALRSISSNKMRAMLTMLAGMTLSCTVITYWTVIISKRKRKKQAAAF